MYFFYRQVIERSFALLFGRFRRLRYIDMNKTEYIPATILAACVLHNICIKHPSENVDALILEGQEHAVRNNTLSGDNASSNVIALSGVEERCRMTNYI